MQRCIQPNPLVVTLKDESVKTELVEAIVTVKLGKKNKNKPNFAANIEGVPLPGKEYLQSVDNTFTKFVDKNFNAFFTLKVIISYCSNCY